MTLRSIYGMAWLYAAGTALLAAAFSWRSTATHMVGPEVPPLAGTAAEWFSAMRPYCNPVEVEVRHRFVPPPSTIEGASLSAACYALAGRVDQARSILANLPEAEQWRGAGIVFNIAHPVADAGDDRSAGPVMELVVEFWPNHYMALYHAGMSNFELNRDDRAEVYLRAFLNHYDIHDGWRREAERALRVLRQR